MLLYAIERSAVFALLELGWVRAKDKVVGLVIFWYYNGLVTRGNGFHLELEKSKIGYVNSGVGFTGNVKEKWF